MQKMPFRYPILFGFLTIFVVLGTQILLYWFLAVYTPFHYVGSVLVFAVPLYVVAGALIVIALLKRYVFADDANFGTSILTKHFSTDSPHYPAYKKVLGTILLAIFGCFLGSFSILFAMFDYARAYQLETYGVHATTEIISKVKKEYKGVKYYFTSSCLYKNKNLTFEVEFFSKKEYDSLQIGDKIDVKFSTQYPEIVERIRK